MDCRIDADGDGCVCSKDVRLPVQMQRAMAAEAESAREAKAKVCLISQVTISIIMQPSYRPHYACCPSIYLTVPCGLVTRKQKKNVKKSKFVYTLPRARASGAPVFSWKVQRPRSPDVKNLEKLPHIWRRIKRRWLRRQQQTRPNHC